MDFAYTLAGFAVGAIVGLTGVGGGSLMTPLLVLLFGINPSVAVGTDLLYASITKAGGTVVHSLKGSVDWRITGRLVAGSIPATVATIFILSQVGRSGHGTSGVISVALGIALLLTAGALIFRRRLQAYALARPQPSQRAIAVAAVATGIVLGVLVSISSVGAGALGVAALIFLYPQLPAVRIVGSDIAHAVPLTLVAGLGHWLLGSVDWALLGSLLIGSLPGIALGSHVSTKVPERVLRLTLAVMLVVIGGKLIAH